ncbi:MAG: hypothetical protein JNK05_37825 [Myxococcales bacterium]|nr:hypothetical protein [Myxococcales bacterium]
MTMVIDLGLERYFYGAADDARVAAVRAFVEQRVTTRVREVIGSEKTGVRVYEAARSGDDVVGRWLEESDAAPIAKDVEALYAKHGSYASFSWSEVDSLFFQSPELSIVCDDEGTEVALPGDERKIRVADLSEFGFSSRRHAGLAATRAMLALAKKHRLIVHCA